ncbi:low molecular weight phosphotyrosine protein phosphatase [Nocardioides marmoriginsengisoli]|uniref:protein-tyrosine-phosphatase n=1 Tax=Nocardioides marmoriginsengisoli TaxID=661483 RepID=A0A3N0CC21_9ACTN|nr:low molecular weight protein-tyrosine-phosphatase [Nocardioides marmoriginsengisoli]RNL60523.1 low molecular weight phosphotyrosine protein phosphatase [Nocardioides marmoriginsengisoli]
MSAGVRRVAFVCLGNICRSPTADVVMAALLERAGVDGVSVESCGTADWHVGGPMDRRTAAVLDDAGYDPSRHRARQFGPSWFDHDLILTMDATNHADVLAMLPADRHDRVRLFRSFDPEVDRTGPIPDVPDPWSGGEAGFLEVLAIVERSCRVLLSELVETA